MPGWASSSARRETTPLPTGFTSIRDILDEQVIVGTMVNVVGLVKDFRLPIPTTKADYKAAITLFDFSTQDDGDGIKLDIFRPEKQMPYVNAADIVLLWNVKVQRYGSNPLSLISNFRTAILVFSASKIPKLPKPADVALQPAAQPSDQRPLKEKEVQYVSYLYHTINKDYVPDAEQFSQLTKQSLNVKSKFSLLRDVSEGHFYDLIVQVAREPYDLGDKVTLHVSDYTENSGFFNYTWEGVQDLDSGRDVYGYTSKKGGDEVKKWVGPYGQKVIQVTCYEPQFIRDAVKAGDWISIKNMQVKFGSNGAHLEGFVRQPRNGPGDSNSLNVLDTHDRETIDPRLKDAIRRWRDYTKDKRTDLKEIQRSQGATKRKLDENVGTSKGKSKKQRKRRRLEAEKMAEEEEAKAREKKKQEAKAEEEAKEEEDPALNKLIICESIDKRPTTVESILAPHFYETTHEEEEIRVPLPFVCMKYRTKVRVVDFHPKRLEEFAISRRVTAFDVLSDNSADEDTSNSEDDDDSDDGGPHVWEWRFALQLEDASEKVKAPRRMWVVINNMEAQYLTGLNASNLHHDEDNLTALRERLFTLWGELEEHKRAQLTKEAKVRKGKPGAVPPPMCSDDEANGNRSASSKSKGTVANKPFICCIRQYGVEVRDSIPNKLSDGPGKRWQRVFGLFGTKISS